MATVRKTTIKKAPARPRRVPATKASTQRASIRRMKAATEKRAPSLNGKNGKGKQVKPLLNQKEALQMERANVESELVRLRAELQEAPEMTGDEVDLNVYEREKTLGLVAAFERRLEEIDATIQVAAQGKYGICERCGAAIPPERLEIFPETRLCVNCKNETEKELRRLRL